MEETITHFLEKHTTAARRELQRTRRWLFFHSIALSISIGGNFLQSSNLSRSLENHRPEPFLLVVDRETGAYKTIQKTSEFEPKQPELMMFREAMLFVRAWERYDPNNRNEDFYYVQARADTELWRQYIWRYTEDNENNLYDVLKTDTVDVQFISFLPIGEDGIQIEYRLIRTHSGSGKKTRLDYIARLNYELVNTPKGFVDAVDNPTGFMATAYTTALKNPLDEVAHQ